MRRHRQLTLAGFATVVALLAAASPATAVVPSGNVLRNPGAEAAPGGLSTTAQVPVPDWAPTTTFTAVAYSTGSGFPDAAASAGLGGGANFFAGGRDSETATGTQEVDLAAAGPEIDSGVVRAALSGQLGGYESQGDAVTVTTTWLDAAGGTLGAPLVIGPVTPADRANLTKLLPRAANTAVPKGTRRARVVISAVRTNGSYNDGYADNLSLVLAGKLPEAAKVIVFPPSKTCTSRRAFRIRLRQPGGLQIASATVFVNGKRVRVVRGKRVTAPVNLTGLPKGRFVVRIEIATTDGRTLSGKRVYRTCAKKRTGSGGPRL